MLCYARCDRVLWRESGEITSLEYGRLESRWSDHRPVAAALRLDVAVHDEERMLQVRADMPSPAALRRIAASCAGGHGTFPHMAGAGGHLPLARRVGE